MKLLHATQNSAFKNHPKDILRDKNNLYGIVLVHIIHTTALNITKHLQVARYRIFKNYQNSNFSLTDCLTASLTTVARLEAKRNSAWSPFYATITNSPVECGSDECRPSVPCPFFYVQSSYLSFSSSNETISRH